MVGVAKPKKATVDVPKAIDVSVAPVTYEKINHTLSSLGSLFAKQKVMITPVVSGRVQQVFFKDGDTVEKGMPIIQLDDATQKAAVQTAQTALNLAKTNQQRSKLLWGQGAISKKDLDQINANVENAAADLKSVQAALNQMAVKAPFSGILGSFKVQKGDYATAGNSLVTLVNRTQLVVKYNLPESRLPALKLGQTVVVHVAAYPKDAFYGSVSYISPTVNPNNGAITLQAVLPNPNNKLSPGMFVSVTQVIAAAKKSLVIPEEAVSADVAGFHVFRIDGNHAVQQVVKIGQRAKGMAEVLQGLKAGQQVVIAGVQKLQDGSLVSVVAKKSPQKLARDPVNAKVSGAGSHQNPPVQAVVAPS